jgi:hypothetical protein
MKINLSKSAMPLIGFVVFTWIARALWQSPYWETAEDIALSLFAILVAIKTIQDARQSNIEKQACSKIIEQINFITKPNMSKDKPFRNAEILGWLLGSSAIYLLIVAVLKIKS